MRNNYTAPFQPLRPVPWWQRSPGAVKWGQLMRGVVWGITSFLAFRGALFLAQLPTPLRETSLVVLLVALAALFLSGKALWHWVCSVSALQGIIAIAIIYLAAVLLTAFIETSTAGFWKAVWQAAGSVPRTVVEQARPGIGAVIQYPSRFSMAYRHRSGNELAAVDANSAQEAEIVIPIPKKGKASVPVVKTGIAISLTSKAAGTCRLDAISDDQFYRSKAARVVEGPVYEKSEAWWRVQNEDGAAWCPAKVIAP